MERISNAVYKIGSGGKSAIPKVGSTLKSGLSAVGKFGSRLIKGTEAPSKKDDIASVLSDADIKYGDEVLLNDEAVSQHLNSSKPKDVVKALNTILSVLVYSTNSESVHSLAPRLDSALADYESLRSRVMKKFYHTVVK